MNKQYFQIAFLVLAGLLSVGGLLNSAQALLLGVFIALSFGHSYQKQIAVYSKKLLAISIVGLGAGVDLQVIYDVGLSGIIITFISITAALSLGLLLGRLIKTAGRSNLLISVGTAICGGSAIAAIAPVIRAKDSEITLCLSIVFLLNAIALLIFPFVGNWLELSQLQFGYWAALAIHDTSSVVGAGLQYGEEALNIATTLKLVRALWIVPVSLFFYGVYAQISTEQAGQGAPTQIKFPWFIIGFVIMAFIFSYLPNIGYASSVISAGAKKLLILVMYMIGLGFTREAMNGVDYKLLLQAILLWGVVSISSLVLIILYI
ncbi:MAG: putative sulfate exporter family transporter [Micavibrio sp.]|nr:putative sulfate exporter family transporter [Micavibrio sp.]|tara:strand:- start:975 stop:1931 length:957 start_codon:yes stop_codon:yes gene_type:complete